MSELEIQRRQEYKKNRKKWTLVQLVAIIVLAAVALVSFLIYGRMNRTYYVEYTENADIDYKVRYKNNDFFDGEWIEKDQSYISALISEIVADFVYTMNTESSDVGFNYKYKIDATLLIASKENGTPYYTVTENIVPEKNVSSAKSSKVEIKETASIDYVKFDEIARNFVDVYDIKNVSSSTLIVTLDVEVNSSNDRFNKEDQNHYKTALNIPLAADSFNIHRTSDSIDNEINVLEYQGVADRKIFSVISGVSIALAVFLTLVLLVFLRVTKNEDITYAARIRKILRSYGSFIQRMNGEFDYDGYQVVNIKTFVEMLGIRDTIQSPVLMSENKDETMTRFFIPTNTQLLYVFEIKVDNYDEIYARIEEAEREADAPEQLVAVAEQKSPIETEVKGAEEPLVIDTAEPAAEEVAEEPATKDEAEPAAEEATEEPATEEETEPAAEEATEEPATEEETEPVAEEAAEEPATEEEAEPVAEEAAEEPVEKPELITSILDSIIEAESDSDESDGDEALAYVDGDGNVVKITCARSFTANLIQSNPQIKEYYNEIKNYILSFKGVKARTSWRMETYKKGRIQLFKMKIRGKTICLYCALNPNDYDSSKYFQEVSDAKVFANVPMMVRIKSDRGLKRAKTLVDDVMTKFFIVPDKKAEKFDYVEEYPYDTTKSLVERGLIKILLPDASPAEPKPHHHVCKKRIEVIHDDVVEEIEIFTDEGIDEALIEEIAAEPTPELEAIDYDDASEEIGDFVETKEHPGVDVIGVVWPERPKRNKIYRYDPDGEIVSVGDVVVVPTRDASKDREVIRKAAVAHANHKVDPDQLTHPLKKIVGVLHTKRLDEEEQKQ